MRAAPHHHAQVVVVVVEVVEVVGRRLVRIGGSRDIVGLGGGGIGIFKHVAG